MPQIPERFVWATELMKVKSTDQVLEIGCGAGLLAEIVASRIETGRLTAVDKSVSMIVKARKRNQIHIKKGIAEFIASEVLKIDLPRSHFDAIVAFNVNFFLKDSPKELKLLQNVIKKNGKLYIFYQAPFEITISDAKPIKENLLKNGFNVVDVKLKRLKPTSSICVIAKPM